MGHVTRQIYLSPYLTETPQKKPSAKQHNQTKKKNLSQKEKKLWMAISGSAIKILFNFVNSITVQVILETLVIERKFELLQRNFLFLCDNFYKNSMLPSLLVMTEIYIFRDSC